MKARNNKTGEIVTNFFMSKEFGTISYLDSNKTLRLAHACDNEWTILEDKNDDFSDSFDWRSFRAEAAKDILCAVLPSIQIIDGDFSESLSNAISNSIDTADELVKQLKKEEK